MPNFSISVCGIKFLDHLIFNETEHSSMYQLGYINDMLLKSRELISYSAQEVDLVKNKNQRSVDLSDIDLGDVSIADKLKKKRK